jgi:hypothetical protein
VGAHGRGAARGLVLAQGREPADGASIVEMLVLKGGPSVSDTSNDASSLQTVVDALS